MNGRICDVIWKLQLHKSGLAATRAGSPTSSTCGPWTTPITSWASAKGTGTRASRSFKSSAGHPLDVDGAISGLGLQWLGETCCARGRPREKSSHSPTARKKKVVHNQPKKQSVRSRPPQSQESPEGPH